MAYTPEQRLAIVTAICDNYAELTEDGRGATWEKCIGAQEIDRATFYGWVNKFDEINALYKAAQDKRAKTERAIIERTARGRLLRRIQDGQLIRRTERGKDPQTGEFVIIKRIVEHRECSDNSLFFALKNLDSAFEENKPPSGQSADDGRIKIDVTFVNPTQSEGNEA